MIGDVHLADAPPSIRTETYRDDILAKLRFIAQDALERECGALIGLGDMFHIKTPGRNSHRLVSLTAEALTAYDGDVELPVLLVDGNHDQLHARSDLAALAGQPLGVLTRIPPISLLRGPLPGTFDGATLVGFPWVEPLSKENTTALRMHRDLLAGVAWEFTSRLIIATHASIFPDHETPPYEHIHASDYADVIVSWLPQGWTGEVTIAYGHIHDPHGTYEVSTSSSDVPHVQFINNGAISRGSLHTETLKRKPVYTILETKTGEAETVPIPHKPAHEVFMLTKHELTKDKAEEPVVTDVAEEFLSTVASGTSGMGRFSVEHLLFTAKEKVSKAAVDLIEEIIS